jgi:thiol peroxidase
MAKIMLKGNPVETIGALPALDTRAPAFILTRADLTEASLADFSGKKIVLNIFPSLDTSVCAASVRRFNTEASNLENTVVLCVSADLPFAADRFCSAEGLNNVITLSTFRHPEFGKAYGVTIIDGDMKGLLSRAIVIIDEQGKVMFTEQVPEISQEPEYEAALKAITGE